MKGGCWGREKDAVPPKRCHHRDNQIRRAKSFLANPPSLFGIRCTELCLPRSLTQETGVLPALGSLFRGRRVWMNSPCPRTANMEPSSVFGNTSFGHFLIPGKLPWRPVNLVSGDTDSRTLIRQITVRYWLFIRSDDIGQFSAAVGAITALNRMMALGADQKGFRGHRHNGHYYQH